MEKGCLLLRCIQVFCVTMQMHVTVSYCQANIPGCTMDIRPTDTFLVKMLKLKIDLHSHFIPNAAVEFEQFGQNIFW